MMNSFSRPGVGHTDKAQLEKLTPVAGLTGFTSDLLAIGFLWKRGKDIHSITLRLVANELQESTLWRAEEGQGHGDAVWMLRHFLCNRGTDANRSFFSRQW